MLPTNVHSCARCGRTFAPGNTRYLVTINLVADFDGTIDAPRTPGETRRMWKEIEDRSEDELFNEVAQKISFILCKPCRDAWVKSPLGDAPDRESVPAGQVH